MDSKLHQLKKDSLDYVYEYMAKLLKKDMDIHTPYDHSRQFVRDGYRVVVNLIYSIKEDFRCNSAYTPNTSFISSHYTWGVSENFYFPIALDGYMLHVSMEVYIEK